MTTKAQKIRIGMFTIASGVLVAITLVVFGGLRFWEGHDHYRIRFDSSVYGLEHGAQVYLNGIKVGTVDGVEIASDDLRKVEVSISIASGTPIHVDTRASLQYAGITGLKVIDLRGGSLSTPELPPGSQIAQGETALDKLEKQAQSIVDQSTELLGRLNKVADNLAVTTDPAKLDGIMTQTKMASANLADASAGLKATIAENRVALHQTILTFGETAKSAQTMVDGQISQVLTNANDLVSEMKGFVHDNGGSLRSAIFDLRQASRSFKEMSREVRQKPSRLLFSGSPKDRKLP